MAVSSAVDQAECKVGGEEMKALHKTLMDGYDRVVRPSLDYSNPTDVTMQLYVSNFIGLVGFVLLLKLLL